MGNQRESALIHAKVAKGHVKEEPNTKDARAISTVACSQHEHSCFGLAGHGLPLRALRFTCLGLG